MNFCRIRGSKVCRRNVILVPMEKKRKVRSWKYFYNQCHRGVYIKLEIHVLPPPPPSWFIFFPQMKFFKRRGCAPQARSFQPYFQFWKLWGNNKHTFFSSKNMHFFTLIHLPLIIFSPTWLNIHGPQGEGGGQTEKYTPLTNEQPASSARRSRGPAHGQPSSSSTPILLKITQFWK